MFDNKNSAAHLSVYRYAISIDKGTVQSGYLESNEISAVSIVHTGNVWIASNKHDIHGYFAMQQK